MQEENALKSKWIVLSIVVMVIVFITVAVFAYFKYFQPQDKQSLRLRLKTLNNGSAAAISPISASPAPVNLKTFYTDIFSFSYPQQFSVFESAEGFYHISGANISVDARTWKNTAIDDAVEKITKELSDSSTKAGANGRRELSGIDLATGVPILTKFTLFPFKEGTVAVHQKGPAYSQIFATIVDSLKFKNGQAISRWESYTNQSYRISFSYPLGWTVAEQTDDCAITITDNQNTNSKIFIDIVRKGRAREVCWGKDLELTKKFEGQVYDLYFGLDSENRQAPIFYSQVLSSFEWVK